MTPDFLYQSAIQPALSILPAKMDSKEARAMLLAIAGQESACCARWQMTGTARGYWQCESIAIEDVNQRAGDYLRAAMVALDYPGSLMPLVWSAIYYDSVLAAVVARLILWLDHDPLPALTDEDGAWTYYARCWRPGKPDKGRWHGAHAAACRVVG